MANPATDLTTSRLVDATREQIFAAISNPSKLARWWGPAGFSNTFELFEFKTGGAWKFTMHGPDGKDYFNENHFLEINAPERVVIRHVLAPLFTLTITLTTAGQQTRIDWLQSFDDPAVCDAVRHICVPANEQNLDRLPAELTQTNA